MSHSRIDALQQHISRNRMQRCAVTPMMATEVSKRTIIFLMAIWGVALCYLVVYTVGFFVLAILGDIYSIFTFHWFDHRFLLVEFFSGVTIFFHNISTFVAIAFSYIISTIFSLLSLIMFLSGVHYLIVMLTLFLIYRCYLITGVPRFIEEEKRAIFIEVFQFFLWVELTFIAFVSFSLVIEPFIAIDAMFFVLVIAIFWVFSHYLIVILTLLLIYGCYLNIGVPECIWKRATFTRISWFFLQIELFTLVFIIIWVISVYPYTLTDVPQSVLDIPQSILETPAEFSKTMMSITEKILQIPIVTEVSKTSMLVTKTVITDKTVKFIVKLTLYAMYAFILYIYVYLILITRNFIKSINSNRG